MDRPSDDSALTWSGNSVDDSASLSLDDEAPNSTGGNTQGELTPCQACPKKFKTIQDLVDHWNLDHADLLTEQPSSTDDNTQGESSMGIQQPLPEENEMLTFEASDADELRNNGCLRNRNKSCSYAQYLYSSSESDDEDPNSTARTRQGKSSRGINNKKKKPIKWICPKCKRLIQTTGSLEKHLKKKHALQGKHLKKTLESAISVLIEA